MHAVIRTGGKQYRVEAHQILDVARFAAEAGSMVEFSDVLLVEDAGEVELGTPFVEGARVVAEVVEQGRDAKILVFKYKNKTRYRRRKGHRQAYTRVAVRQILGGGREATEIEEKPRRRPRRRTTTEKREEPVLSEPGAITEGVPSLAATEATVEKAPATAAHTDRTRKASQPSTETMGETSGAGDAKPTRRARTKTVESGE
ncbi:MAG: 50S ribosomal protein L21 [Chloroflexi bacterium]|nr:MAG: 50S ribosomal protein L21 [Chloroflexota bacterium]